MAEQGFRTIRFTNHDVLADIDSVLEAIVQALEATR